MASFYHGHMIRSRYFKGYESLCQVMKAYDRLVNAYDRLVNAHTDTNVNKYKHKDTGYVFVTVNVQIISIIIIMNKYSVVLPW